MVASSQPITVGSSQPATTNPTPPTAPLTYTQHAQKVASEWKLITKSCLKKISTASTLPNILPLAKGNAMSINKLNKHTTTKVIISAYAKALYGMKLNVNMKKLNLVMAYQKLGAQPTSQPSTLT